MKCKYQKPNKCVLEILLFCIIGNCAKWLILNMIFILVVIIIKQSTGHLIID